MSETKSLQIRPYFLGSGNAAQALNEAWKILEIARPGYLIEAPVPLKRGAELRPAEGAYPVLCICNPAGLHAKAILAGAMAGFKLIVAEKPACVSLDEAKALAAVTTPVAVCHVYRQHWGVQTLRRMVDAGELGEVITIEGRYWQSSAAQRASREIQAKPGNWKNDPLLSGPFDTLLDVGVHWVDAALFVLGSEPVKTDLWLSYANAETPHRDSHVQLQMSCANGARLFASISKAVHGAPNHFEINVLGTKKSATWKFLEPDQIEIGQGSSRVFVSRSRGDANAIHGPFHGLGWVEGYVGILDAALKGRAYPTLPEHLRVIEALLGAASIRSNQV